jgi:hypothetical protein
LELDLVTIGDPTIDTFLKIHDAHLALQVQPNETQLCIDYADNRTAVGPADWPCSPGTFDSGRHPPLARN